LNAWKEYYRELNLLIPLEANPHLELFSRPSKSTPPKGFTIAFFPPDRLRKPEALAPPGGLNGKPPTAAKPYYTYCLEVTQAGGWRKGWGVDARFTLLSPDTPLIPIRRAGEPVTRVLDRRTGLWGFRPLAVRMTEEQLAGRFFPVLEDLARGAETQPIELRPDDQAAIPVTAFVRRLLESRLGGTAPAPIDPPQSLEAQMDPDRQFSNSNEPLEYWNEWPRLEKWVEWPRRFNGGTPWGAIQFAVVLLGVRFTVEWIVVYWLIRRTERSQSNYQGRSRDWFRARTHTLRGIVAVLPVVGFLGTVAGLSNSLIGSSGVSSDSSAERQAALQAMEVALGTAFDKSILAFATLIACLSAERWLAWKIGTLR
jgi:hypothetical protein